MPLAATRAVPQYAVDAIRRLIETEGYAPGAALPAQRELAERLGVSRASLREALSTLSALGLVSVQPGRGVYVQEATGAPDGHWPFAGEVAAAHVFQLRFALEGFAAGLAAVTLGPPTWIAWRSIWPPCTGRCGPTSWKRRPCWTSISIANCCWPRTIRPCSR